jgi:hypothetical protein
MFQQVSVWLDELAPAQGAFAHALEWGRRLRLPLHGVRPVAGDGRGTPGSVIPERCAEACARNGVPWELSLCREAPARVTGEFLRPQCLCAFGQSLPAALRGQLLRSSLSGAQAALLVCPQTWTPLSRVLLLNQGRGPAGTFLPAAVEVCQALGVSPVVLTLARSETEARSRQRSAEEILAGHRLAGDFDFVVGCDVRAAVALEVHCRRCTHVFLDRRNATSWWGWRPGDTMRRLLGLADSLTFLAFSGAWPARGSAPQPCDGAQGNQPCTVRAL